MIHLLDALQDSENTVGKSMLSLFNSMQGVLSETIMRLEKNFESVFVNINIFQPGAQFDNIHDPHPP